MLKKNRKYRFEVASFIDGEGNVIEEMRFESRWYAQKYINECLQNNDKYLRFNPDQLEIKQVYDYFVIKMSKVMSL